jgi:hypothetical protein
MVGMSPPEQKVPAAPVSTTARIVVGHRGLERFGQHDAQFEVDGVPRAARFRARTRMAP